MPTFRAANGNWLSRALFYETTLSDKSQVVYTLKHEDHEGYPSLYRLYLETADPTEYLFAQAHLGGWPHWEYLLDNKWFTDFITAWRRELNIKLRSHALVQIRTLATTSPKDSFAANKYLLDGGWADKAAKKRGAPTKAEINAEAVKIAETNEQIEKDYERVMN